MCEALRELMKDEIQAEKDAAAEAATKAVWAEADKNYLAFIKSLMKKMKLTAQQAMDVLSIPVSDQKRYSFMLKNEVD